MAQVGPADLRKPVREFARPIQTTVRQDQTLAAALATLRERTIDHAVTYVYVLDEQDRLRGVVPTRRLLLEQPERLIRDVMTSPIVSVKADDTVETAMALFALHRYLALPVVESDGKLVGAISVQLYADEAWELAQAERVADAFQLIGVWVDAIRQCSPGKSYRLRMPWLLCNIVGGLGCALIATLFGGVLEQVLVIAAFIPMILTLAEAVSVQSLTLALQHMHASRVNWRQWKTLAAREWKIAGLMGLTAGGLVAVLALFWGLSLAVPAVIVFSVLVTTAAAATFGLAVPALLHTLKLDPKIAAGPVVLMGVDATSTFIYLGLATLLLT
jgi:magnesium transporter